MHISIGFSKLASKQVGIQNERWMVTLACITYSWLLLLSIWLQAWSRSVVTYSCLTILISHFIGIYQNRSLTQVSPYIRYIWRTLNRMRSLGMRKCWLGTSLYRHPLIEIWCIRPRNHADTRPTLFHERYWIRDTTINPPNSILLHISSGSSKLAGKVGI